MQLAKENNFSLDLQKPKDETTADINSTTVSEILKSALTYFSAIQAHDGHWPGDFPGPLFTTATMVRYSMNLMFLVTNILKLYAPLSWSCILYSCHPFTFTGHSYVYFFLLQIIVLYVTESLGIMLSSEHRKEIRRYLYNRQVRWIIARELFIFRQWYQEVMESATNYIFYNILVVCMDWCSSWELLAPVRTKKSMIYFTKAQFVIVVLNCAES